MSDIQIWIEKSQNGSAPWTKASSSFSELTLSIFNASNVLIETKPITDYFPNSHPTETTYYIIYDSNSISGNVNNSFMTWNVDPTLNEPITPSYQYRLSISSTNNEGILFNPTGTTFLNKWELNIENPNILPNPSITPVGGNYWNFSINPGTYGSSKYGTKFYYNSPTYLYNKKRLTLESVNGNYYYNTGYYQAQIPYKPSFNSRFKNSIEPVDIQFPNIIDDWKLKIGDEIRFENDENKLYRIENIEFEMQYPVEKLIITVDKDIPNSTNLNFFLIRRWKENRNNLSINEIFPYSNILPSTSLAPSTTGFIFPKYPVDEIAKNPDKIIRDLIDKKIIE